MKTEWRSLTEAELRSWPPARMGGALLAIVVVTGALSLTLVVIVVMLAAALVMNGPEAFVRMLWAGGSGQRYVLVGYISAAFALALLVGGLIVFILALTRASATPAIASIGAALLFCLEIAINLTNQWILMNGDAGLVATAIFPMFPHWLGSLAAAAGFTGYMLGGVRPNAHFRRRVAVPSL